MASKRAVISTFRAASRKPICSSVSPLASSVRELHVVRKLHAPAGSNKIVGVFHKANEYASLNPNFLGCVENALGIREWLESKGHQYIVTDDTEGPDCELEKHIPDLHVLIATPFHSVYMSEERIKKAKNLKLLLTAGVGSDHINLGAAQAADVTVSQVTGSNAVSVAEDALMRILILVRNFVPGYKQIVNGDWKVAAISYRSYDLEGKTIGTIGAGRIGKELLKRLKPFNCKLLYHDLLSIGPELEKETGATLETNLDDMLPKCDVVVINMPLADRMSGVFDKEEISKMKKGVLIVNNSRGAIMDAQAVADASASGHIGGYSGDVWEGYNGAIMDCQAVADAIASGHIGGYSGDVWEGYSGDIWFPEPAPKDHPWRSMPNHAMTPHISGTTIDAQIRYAAGTKDMLDRYFRGEDFPPQHYIIKERKFASQYYL